MGAVHNRHSIRLKGYDYSRNGAYFITIVCQDRHHRFGEIVKGSMVLNDAGKMVQSVWRDLPKFYGGVFVDQSIIMPNHFHGIIVINNTVGAAPCGYPDSSKTVIHNDVLLNMDHDVSLNMDHDDSLDVDNDDLLDVDNTRGQARGPAPTAMSMSDVVHRFKSFTTHRYCNGVKMGLVQPFRKRLWQRNFYESIIKNEIMYDHIRAYIINNPRSWKEDRFENSSDGVEETSAVYGDDWRVVC